MLDPFNRRRRVPVLTSAVAILALTLVTSVSARRAHDQNLDDADNSIQKALAFVEAVQPMTGPPRAARRFERHLKNAQRALDEAREQLAAAAAVQDSVQ